MKKNTRRIEASYLLGDRALVHIGVNRDASEIDLIMDPDCGIEVSRLTDRDGDTVLRIGVSRPPSLDRVRYAPGVKNSRGYINDAPGEGL